MGSGLRKGGLLLGLAALLLAAGVAEGDGGAKKRAKARQQRAAARKRDGRLRELASARMGNDLTALVRRCIDVGLLPLGWELVRDVERKDPAVPGLDELGARLDRARGVSAKKPPPKGADKKIRRDYRVALRRCAGRLVTQAKQLVRRGDLELAHACFLSALRYAPNSETASKYVAAVFVPERDRWVPTCVTQGFAEKGRTWDRTLGWVLDGHADKYAAGLYPRFGRDRVVDWSKLEDLNAGHRAIRNPWRLDTRHFEIRGSTDLRHVVAVANWLEEFYAPWIATFARVFGDKAKDRLFRSERFPKLQVTVLHSKEMWGRWLRTNSVEGISEEVPGLYIPETGISVFYVSETLREIARHEVTHQLLHRALGSKPNDVNTFMDEGLATFVEAAHVGNSSVAGGGAGVIAISAASPACLTADDRPALTALLDLSYGEFHAAESEEEHYLLAGAWTAFFMTYEEGLYADDYVDFMALEAWGQPSRAVATYFGVSPKDLESQFEGWIRGELEIGGMGSGSVEAKYGDCLHRGRDDLEAGDLAHAEATLGFAMKYFERSVDLPGSPHDTRWRFAASCELMARVMRNSGRANQAKQLLRKAIPHRRKLPAYGGTTKKKLASCHYLLGLLHYESGWLSSAQEEFAECIRVLEALRQERGDQPDAWFLLPAAYGHYGSVLLAAEHKEQADTVLKKATQEFPESPELDAAQAWILATCADVRYRDAPRAVALATRAVSENEESAWYRLVLGTALLRAEENTKAVAELTRSLELSGEGCGLHWYGLAAAHGNLGQKKEARSWMRRRKDARETRILYDCVSKADLQRLREEAERLVGR